MGSISRTPLGAASLARQWWVDLYDNGAWIPVRGVANIGLPLSVSTDEVATANPDGWAFTVKAQMAWSLVLTLTRKQTLDAAATYDAGQELLRDAGDDSWGAVTVRWYKQDGLNLEAYQGIGIVQYSPAGGGTSDLDTVDVTITGQGARTRIPFPAVG